LICPNAAWANVIKLFTEFTRVKYLRIGSGLTRKH
jgi:hypothetical protein